MRGETMAAYVAFDVRDVDVDDVDVLTKSLGIALPVEVLVVGDLKLGGFVRTVEVIVCTRTNTSTSCTCTCKSLTLYF